jgi:general secretion pathway protein M
MISEFWTKLDQKQRYFLAGGAVFVIAALIFEFGISSFWEARGKTKQAVQINQKKLQEIVMLDAQFARQEAKIVEVKKMMALRPADFSLFAYLEKKAAQAGVKGHIKNMSSSHGTQRANYEESLLDVKLDKITMKQLTDFLYYAESPADLIKIKRITVSKMKESPEYLTAQLQLASFQILAKPAGGK